MDDHHHSSFFGAVSSLRGAIGGSTVWECDPDFPIELIKFNVGVHARDNGFTIIVDLSLFKKMAARTNNHLNYLVIHQRSF